MLRCNICFIKVFTLLEYLIYQSKIIILILLNKYLLRIKIYLFTYILLNIFDTSNVKFSSYNHISRQSSYNQTFTVRNLILISKNKICFKIEKSYSLVQ